MPNHPVSMQLDVKVPMRDGGIVEAPHEVRNIRAKFRR